MTNDCPKNIAVLICGPAGSGKSLWAKKLMDWLKDNKPEGFTVECHSRSVLGARFELEFSFDD